MRDKKSCAYKTANKPTGKSVTAYKASFFHSSLFCIISMIVAAKANIIINTEKIKNVTPSINFCGRVFLKSFSRKGDVRIDKNRITDVKVNVRDITSLTVKMTKKVWCRRTGVPVSDFEPPGTVYAAAKATVAMRTATIVQFWAVFLSHSWAFWWSSLLFSSKTCLAVWPLLFRWLKKWSEHIFSIRCK